MRSLETLIFPLSFQVVRQPLPFVDHITYSFPEVLGSMWCIIILNVKVKKTRQ